ncbi:c-terminal region family protein [Stylonychia lemnae]|uniref:C-terminal region family protein n=1 Tax=Stylonychia lemnae TaxID=5949 RepID=A0A078B3I1_STYLE|nr:c-terminal region family protein [Stylonychia lemnae]|eukprot:CDW88811.1 c-terminal region family protein [Stylonychia lemnae]
MKKDFYDVLSIKRNASDEQISTAFKKLALRHHPLKNPAEMNINLQKFHEICEAYEILSNLQFKTIYDQFGEDVLREGLRDDKGNFTGGYVYQQNCYQIFDTYFLQYNPFFNIFDSKGHDLHGSLFGTGFGGANEPEPPRIGDIFVQIPCTLFEFYNGCIKKITYQRQQLALDGHTIKIATIEKQIAVKPGFSQANSLTFKGEGHQMKKYKSDLIVSFHESAHTLNGRENANQLQLIKNYQRRGNDLIYTAQISLSKAINADPVRLETFDGRILMVPVDQVIGPKTVIKIEGQGMPIYKQKKFDDESESQEQQMGDLHLRFEIEFPKTLREDQRLRIEKILALADD